MALPPLKLFIDPKANTAYPSFESGTSISNPAFYLGDTTNLELYLIDNSTAERKYIDFPASPTIKVAVGEIDTPPSAGTFTLTFGADTTSALAYNITAAELQTALNALSSITSAGGVTVSLIGNSFSIAFNNVGARTDITSNGSGLVPLSSAQITTIQQGTVSLPEIALLHLQVLVAGYTNSFTAGDAPSATISTTQSWANNRVVYKLKLNNACGGTFTLSYNRSTPYITPSTLTTEPISYLATASDISKALEIFDSQYSTPNIFGLGHSVFKNSDGSIDISFYNYGNPSSGWSGPSNQPDTGGLTCNISGISTTVKYSGNLSLNTTGAISLLRGSTAVQTSFAVSVTSAGNTQTVLQIPCILYANVIDDGVVAPVGLDTYLTQSAGDSRYMLSSGWTGITFPDTTTQTTAAYSKAYIDANYTTTAGLGTSFVAAGTAVLRNGTYPMTGNLSFGGYNLTNAGTVSGTYANFTTAAVTNISASNSLTVGTGGMAVSTTGITFTDSSVQTVAYPGSSALLLKSNNLSDLTSSSTARTNLGLGTMAVETASNYLTKANNLSGLTDYSTARNNLGLGSLAVYADAPADGNYYVRRNNAWIQCTVYTTGGKNYLTI